jgi:predicted DNA-binding transcriptional regulator AlpA
MSETKSGTERIQFLTLEQVAERYQTTIRTIQTWMKTPGFPKPLRFNRRTLRFRLSDLEAFERSDD